MSVSAITPTSSGLVAFMLQCTASWIGILGQGKTAGNEGGVPAINYKSITQDEQLAELQQVQAHIFRAESCIYIR